MNPVIHFEMPADDRDRMAEFYASAFGWQARKLGAHMGHYTVVSTTESDATGCPKAPGAINGGFFLKRPDMPAQYPSVVIAVDDVHVGSSRGGWHGAQSMRLGACCRRSRVAGCRFAGTIRARPSPPTA